MSRLVTLLSASLGDRWKNLGVRLGGRVCGFLDGSHGLGLLPPWTDVSQGPGVVAEPPPPGLRPPCSRSKCSTEAGRGCRWRGYQPRAGPPASRSSSAPVIASFRLIPNQTDQIQIFQPRPAIAEHSRNNKQFPFS